MRRYVQYLVAAAILFAAAGFFYRATDVANTWVLWHGSKSSTIDLFFYQCGNALILLNAVIGSLFAVVGIAKSGILAVDKN